MCYFFFRKRLKEIFVNHIGCQPEIKKMRFFVVKLIENSKARTNVVDIKPVIFFGCQSLWWNPNLKTGIIIIIIIHHSVFQRFGSTYIYIYIYIVTVLIDVHMIQNHIFVKPCKKLCKEGKKRREISFFYVQSSTLMKLCTGFTRYDTSTQSRPAVCRISLVYHKYNNQKKDVCNIS